ncbi:hypothetical protein ZIOFF_059511 [Zingiber officinale]|uniref:Endoplasmic reticulum transmembrane protein n=1 Tax=Zingiber officinale TaxID=94328 RepID=A0A8J5F9J1_ZINOF|nr:hypothetical protein ZIOFF_059511 [Zingiber officinale]
MIQLLFTVLAAEAALLFSTTLRKLVVMGVDHLKRGRGPVVVKTVAATALVVFCSSLYSMAKINRRSVEHGTLTPTDQVLMSRNLLEATLMGKNPPFNTTFLLSQHSIQKFHPTQNFTGFILFLALVVDRLHHYVRELRWLRTSLDSATKHDRAL